MRGGFILLHKKLIDSDFWINSPSAWKNVWIYFLLKACWGETENYERGEFRLVAAHEVKKIDKSLSVAALYRCIERMTDAQMIRSSRTSCGLKITICNYEKYQNTKSADVSAAQVAQRPRSERAQVRQRAGVETILKEERINKKEEYIYCRPDLENAESTDASPLSDSDWDDYLKSNPIPADTTSLDIDNDIDIQDEASELETQPPLLENTAPDKSGIKGKKEKKTKASKLLLAYPSDFEEIHKMYPRPDGKAAGFQTYQETITTPELKKRLIKSIENYIKFVQMAKTERKFIKMFSTFMNNWVDWEEWTPEYSKKYNERGDEVNRHGQIISR